ncbi:hypothetical protein R3P38DRAFT_3229200 [Favolaschia claudopus]|uniref:Uncharacterized protein n=1 Tax=Favolaschia claudopus TaxID=2862362 RepID=A0AAV9ZQ28_9AGAR
MHTVLQFAPNITDIFLSFDLQSSDNTSGLCKGLNLINPTRLFLWHDSSKLRGNKMISQLLDSLSRAIPNWKNLVRKFVFIYLAYSPLNLVKRIFDCPYTSSFAGAEKLSVALTKAKQLHTLTLREAYAVSWAYSEFRTCPLTDILVKPSNTYWVSSEGESARVYETDPVVKALVKHLPNKRALRKAQAAAGPVIAPSPNPHFAPLANVSDDVEDEILDRILYFAMPEREPIDDEEPFKPYPLDDSEISPRMAILLVSKIFYRLGLPHYYAPGIALFSFSCAAAFHSILSSHPLVGPRVRSITYSSIYPGGYEPELETAPDGEDWASIVLSLTSGLLRFGGGGRQAPGHTIGDFSEFGQFGTSAYWGPRYIFWQPLTTVCRQAFEILGDCSGSTLRECSALIRSEQPISGAIFEKFTALQKLNWKSEATFTDIVSTDALASLNELWVTEATPSFLSLLSGMKLQSIKRLVYLDSESFQAHGAKLTELVLSVDQADALKNTVYTMCPNLSSLSIYGLQLAQEELQPVKDICPSKPVPSLQKVILDFHHWPKEKANTAAWDTFFRKFLCKRDWNPGASVGLQTSAYLFEFFAGCAMLIRLSRRRDINSSDWVRWAEVLLLGGRIIALTDSDGKKWRPRLK